MNSRILAATLVLAPLGASCSSFSGVFRRGEAGPEQVDDLLSRIERVHVESELSQKSLRGAVGVLHTLVAPDFDGDPIEAYGELTTATDDSKARAKELRASVDEMKRSAGPFFTAWSASLNSFANTELRAKSQDRLATTHDRYQSILDAVEPALVDQDALNSGLEDQALFLEHDFSAAAVQSLQQDVRSLTSLASTLDQRLTAAQNASREYVENNALHGQLPVSLQDDQQAAH